MAFELPPLPYPRDALAPHISSQTLDYWCATTVGIPIAQEVIEGRGGRKTNQLSHLPQRKF
jgi:hypothetical protein